MSAEALTEAIWEGFQASPFIEITRRDAESIARTVLASPALRDLLAEAWEEGHDTCCAVYARHCSYAVNPHHEETP